MAGGRQCSVLDRRCGGNCHAHLQQNWQGAQRPDGYDWNWETYKDADGTTKAIYWDDATEKDRQMLDYFAKFDQLQGDVMEKMRQAVSLITECKELMNGLVKDG